MTDLSFSPEMVSRVMKAVPSDRELRTLGNNSWNSVVLVDPSGIWVRTRKSDAAGTSPQLVPAWMVVVPWEELQETGRISRKTIAEELGVKRSAFVCALLARFPEVEIESTRPIVLRSLLANQPACR